MKKPDKRQLIKKPDIKQIEKELRSLISEIAEVDEKKITDEARFVEDLGMDSMMALEILAAIEKKYRIQIPEEALPKLTTLKDAADLTRKIFKKIEDGYRRRAEKKKKHKKVSKR